MQPVRLHDVLDVEAFVKATLVRSRIRFDDSEREELTGEGLAIMFELADRYDGRGRFSGYAAQFLPRRLTDAWHRMHREHTYATTEAGKREWRYGDTPVSLSHPHHDGAPIQVDPRGQIGAPPPVDPAELIGTDQLPLPTYLGTPAHLLMADTLTPTGGFANTVRQALTRSLEQEVDLHLRVSVLAAAGYTKAKIASELGLSEDELRAVYARLRRCASLLDPA